MPKTPKLFERTTMRYSPIDWHGFAWPDGFTFAEKLANDCSGMMEQYELASVITLIVGIAGIEEDEPRLECAYMVIERLFAKCDTSQKAMKRLVDDARREAERRRDDEPS